MDIIETARLFARFPYRVENQDVSLLTNMNLLIPRLELPAAPLSEREEECPNPVESVFGGPAQRNLIGLADAVLEPSE